MLDVRCCAVGKNVSVVVRAGLVILVSLVVVIIVVLTVLAAVAHKHLVTEMWITRIAFGRNWDLCVLFVSFVRVEYRSE